MIENIVFTGLILSLIYTTKLIIDQAFPRNKILFFIFLLIAVELFYGWLYLSNSIFDFPHLIRINTPLVLLIAPAIFLLIKSTYDANSAISINVNFIGHLTPFFICLVYFMPLYFSTATFKIQYINAFYESLGFDSWLWGGIRRVQHLIYLLLIFRILYKNKHKLSFKTDGLNALMLSLFILLWIADVYRYFFTFNLFSGIINVIIMAGLMIVLAYFNLVPTKNTIRLRYANSSMPIEKRKQIKEMIIQLLESDKFYTNRHLRLSDLSDKMNVSVHDISQTINREFDVNFNEIINKYRAKEARNLIFDKRYDHFTLEAIAEMAGFGSTSSFNNYFRKYYNEAPSVVRKRRFL